MIGGSVRTHLQYVVNRRTVAGEALVWLHWPCRRFLGQHPEYVPVVLENKALLQLGILKPRLTSKPEPRYGKRPNRELATSPN